MHFQTSVPNWDKALLRMPDWVLVKSVNDPSLLKVAYLKWVAAGHNPERLYRDYRHWDLDYTFSTDWDQMIAKWREGYDVVYGVRISRQGDSPNASLSVAILNILSHSRQ